MLYVRVSFPGQPHIYILLYNYRTSNKPILSEYNAIYFYFSLRRILLPLYANSFVISIKIYFGDEIRQLEI